MLSKLRLFAARALFLLVVVMTLGFGLVIAGVAAVIGLLMVAAFRIAMIGAEREAASAARERAAPRAPDPAEAQPA